MFISEKMLIVNAKDGACPSYYTRNLWFNDASDELSFCFSWKLLYALTCFGPYKCSVRNNRLDVDILGSKTIADVYGDNAATKNGFYGHEFETAVAVWVEEESVQLRKRAGAGESSTTTSVFAAVFVIFLVGWERVDINSVSHEYEEYCWFLLSP